jgi:hypothetical protein
VELLLTDWLAELQAEPDREARGPLAEAQAEALSEGLELWEPDSVGLPEPEGLKEALLLPLLLLEAQAELLALPQAEEEALRPKDSEELVEGEELLLPSAEREAEVLREADREALLLGLLLTEALGLWL